MKCDSMAIEMNFASEEVAISDSEAAEIKERMIGLSERICALAEAANILAEASAPFRSPMLAAVNGVLAPIDTAAALDQAARRLEAARLDAVNEFTTLRIKLGSRAGARH